MVQCRISGTERTSFSEALARALFFLVSGLIRRPCKGAYKVCVFFLVCGNASQLLGILWEEATWRSKPFKTAGESTVDKKKYALNRRSLIRGLASTTAVAAVTTIDLREAHAYDPGATETRARYRETEDVRAFYRTNGYETLKK
jgi:hypothetical protein